MENDKDVFVSIIVPAYNEERYIQDCLKSLIALDYPKESYEIIVVDNGSSDNTVELAKELGIHVEIKLGGKVGGVRNHGAKLSKGDVLAFIDGDCVASSEWLSAAINKLQNEDVGAVGGVYLLRDNPSWVELGWVLDDRPVTQKTTSLVGGSFIVKADIFNNLGGFDESINAGEDTKLSANIASSKDVYHLNECAVIHLGYPDKISGFMKRQFWHSSSYFKSNTGLFKDKVFITCILFLLGIFSSIIALMTESFVLFNGSWLLLSPVLFSINRILKSRSITSSLARLHYILLLDYCYFLSRTLGLATSLIYDPFKK
jgi:glycosyltransferase involved in cell wall biosynthesis